MSGFGGKILVIRGGAIGDFVLTLPAIAALRRQFPEAHLEVLGYSHIIQLAVAGGLVNRAQNIEAAALAGFFARNALLPEHMVDYFSEFDLIISYLYDPDDIFKANVSRCTAGQFIAGPHRPSESARVPASRVFLQPLERLAIFEADPVPRLPVKPHPGAPNQVALHPGSGSDRKNWPEQNWADLLRLFIDETTHNLLLVGGEAEGERLQRLAAALPPARLKVAQHVPLAQLAGLLRGSIAFIGHDSGITHIAAAVDLPVLVLWGDTIEEVWRPSGDKVTLLRGRAGLSSLTPAAVFNSFSGLPQKPA